MRKWLCLVSFVLINSGCITIPSTRACAAAGTLSAGAICADTIGGGTSELDLYQFIDFLEAQPERPDPANPGKTLPARGSAICQSADDYNTNKTIMEQMCRMLGKRCKFSTGKASKSYPENPLPEIFE